jgi:hypothetical protein
MTMKLTATDYTVIEEGEYPAQLAKVEELEMSFGPTIKMTFSLLDEDNRGTEVSGLASKAMSPKAKLRGWVEGMLGRALEKGEEIDLESLIGTKVMLYVSVSDTDKGMFNRIEKVRLPRRKVAPKPAPVVADVESEDVPF